MSKTDAELKLEEVVQALVDHEGDPAAQVEAIAAALKDRLPEGWGE